MIKRFTFNPDYFILTILLFAVEVLIALYVHDTIIRPYIGDLLVVILIYCFVKSFFYFSVLKTAIGVLIFSYGIETLQYLKFVEILGLQHSKAANTIIGNSFAWIDLVAYTGGFVTILLAEKFMAIRRENKQVHNPPSTTSL